MSKTAERRKHPRRKIAIRSRIAGVTVSSECETVDLSANGLSCLLDAPLDPFIVVKITLSLPAGNGLKNSPKSGRSVDCEGVVVRSEMEETRGKVFYRTAIFFNHINGEAMDLIQKYVATHPLH